MDIGCDKIMEFAMNIMANLEGDGRDHGVPDFFFQSVK